MAAAAQWAAEEDMGQQLAALMQPAPPDSEDETLEPLQRKDHIVRELLQPRWHLLRRWAAAVLAVAALATGASVSGTAHHGVVALRRHTTSLFRQTSADFLRMPDGPCVDEWEPITSAAACQAAARALGLPDGQPMPRLSKRPTGCYYDAGADSLWLMNTQAGAGSAVFATGWAPEVLCARRGAQSQPSARPQAPHDAMPRHVICQYMVSGDGQAACPSTSVPLNESECRKMPYHFGGTLNYPLVTNSPSDPTGCFFFGGNYRFNNYPTGMGRAGRRVYCKKCQAIEVQDAAGFNDWSGWGSENAQALALARKASARFRRISTGKCSDMGWYPIDEKSACEEAAKYLALPDIEATVTKLVERPEGCYYFRNYMDGTETLWLGTNPWSHGNGAETSDVARGGLRQPICAKQSTVATAASADTSSSFSSTEAPKLDLASYGQFRKISAGRCLDIKSLPIFSESKCAAAAKSLGLVDVHTKTLNSANRPEGCYYFTNTEDLTTTLWLNTSPLSMGNGAQSSQTPRGFREPLCMSPGAAQ